MDFFGAASGPITWTIEGVLLFVTYHWTLRSLTPASVGAYFIAIHLALVLVATALAFNRRDDLLPLGLCNPAPMVIGVLYEKTVGALFTNYRNPRPIDATWFVLAYWIAMGINVAWARRWLIAHFDQLTGRVLPQTISAAPTLPAPQIAHASRKNRQFDRRRAAIATTMAAAFEDPTRGDCAVRTRSMLLLLLLPRIVRSDAPQAPSRSRQENPRPP